MRVCVCSPTKILFDSYASQIDVNTSSGSFGVLPSHVPVIFPLSPGLLTIMSPEKVVEIVVASGYFSSNFLDNKIKVHEDSKVDIFVSEAAYRDEIKLDLVKDATDYFNNMMNKTNDDEQKKYANIALKSIEEYAKLAKN
ncbi:hypothetical protein MXB_4083 [Myxobolus squamalis]|nr:hypothetical protein MXB_4083 [Myxobolus squamalis]